MSRPVPRAEDYSLPDRENETRDATARSNSPDPRSTSGPSPDAQISSAPYRLPPSNPSPAAADPEPPANLEPGVPPLRARRHPVLRKSPGQIGKPHAPAFAPDTSSSR